MSIVAKNPKIHRYYELAFKGIFEKDNVFFVFASDLVSYLVKKLFQFISLIWSLLTFFVILPNKLKVLTIRKLIWSRGKLGRPVANIVVMIFTLTAFLFGEVFNNSKFVSGGEVAPDYLVSVNDIIPDLNTAKTTVPESRQRTDSIQYAVEVGDTLYGIGEKFKISTDALKYVNNLTDYSVLKVGQAIVIPPASGLIHKVESGDTLNSIANKYSVASQAIADFNYLLDTKLSVGTELVIPGAKIPEPVYVAPVYAGGFAGNNEVPVPSDNFCVWPSTVKIITQYFSWYHNGLDIAVAGGRPMPPLFSCRSGTVVRSGWDPYGLGLHVRIDHGDGYETIYGHMSRLDVSYGQKVSRGEVIGIMGSTGNSTGPHVHYMLKYNGVAQNPFNYMN